jgi:hypothetical protein
VKSIALTAAVYLWIDGSGNTDRKARDIMGHTENETRHLYWFDLGDFESSRKLLSAAGYRLKATLLTPCQVLRAQGKTLVFAPPEVWSRVCVRQGSWYRASGRRGHYMVMSDHRLPEALDAFLDSEMSVSDFAPESLPTTEELATIVSSEEYRSQKPARWEKVRWTEAAMFKVMFTLNRIWGIGDNLDRHWLGHRANHANFLSKKVTTERDGEQVAYSVTGNRGVCSSCVEFFNVIEVDSRKLVRACPGSVTLGGAKRDIYYDIKPFAKPPEAPEAEPDKQDRPQCGR